MARYTDSIISLINATVSITRRAETARVNGKVQAPTTSTFSLDVSIQPADGKDLARLPEGEQLNKVFVVWSLQELIAGGKPNVLPDMVTYKGELYQVEHVEPYEGFFKSNHWESIIRGIP